MSAENLGELATLVGDDVINSSTAKKLIKEMFETNASPKALVEERGLAQINDEVLLGQLVAEAVAANPKSVADYKKDKLAAAKAIVGNVMGKTAGKGNPVIINRLLEEELKKY